MSAPAPSYPIGAGPVGPQRDGAYLGISVRETTGAAIASVRIRSGGAVTGPIVDTIGLASGASANLWYGPDGKRLIGGLFVEIVAGAVEGSVTFQ